MKRKTFIKSLSIGAMGSYFLPTEIFPEEFTKNSNSLIADDWIKTEHKCNKNKTTIFCDKITNDIKFIHITDSHLSILKNGKSDFPEYTRRMDGAYLNPKHYLTGKGKTKVAHFEEILKIAKNKKVDFLLLTGDIINNPSIYNIKYLFDKLEESGLDYYYTSGNHDWHFEGMEGRLVDLREEWINKRLLPLYHGNNPLYYSKIIGGINFIFIDNSTYQVSHEQLSFFREQVNLDYPILLSMHIPIYQPENRFNDELYTIGDPRWGYEYDMENYKTERRERWSKKGNTKETLEFVIEILSCKKLVAIFAGHNHAEMNKIINPSANMYLTRASYSGSYRLVEIKKG